ncbi:MAG TPA: LysE family translocator [Candidatus Methylomirabilis sp.]|nr:LysE family translocator [Candidatus Methylomirabilis sp.]
MVEVILSGWLMGVAIALPVGPVITELIRRGLRGGFLQGWLVGLGAAASHVILVSLTLVGVVAFLDRPIWHTLLGGAGTLVLGFLGVDALRASTSPPGPGDGGQGGHPFLAGFSIGISNPITLLWFLTVGGALITAHGGGETGRLAVLFGVSFIFGVLSWDTVVAGLAGYGRRWMGPRTLKALNVTAGLVFFGFALRLLWRLAQTLR